MMYISGEISGYHGRWEIIDDNLEIGEKFLMFGYDAADRELSETEISRLHREIFSGAKLFNASSTGTDYYIAFSDMENFALAMLLIHPKTS